MSVSPIPPGCNSVNAYLVMDDCKAAIAFYAKAFNAEPGVHMAGPDGQGTMHAEIKIGNSTIMLVDESPQWDKRSAKSLGGSPVSLHLYVEDADAVFQQAVAAGCEEVVPVSEMFWGDRYGQVVDPFGLTWGIATHIEDVPPDLLAQRAAEFFSSTRSVEIEQIDRSPD